MNAGKSLLATTIFLLTTVWLASCTGDNPTSAGTSTPPNIVSVSPSDGAEGVSGSASITVQFDVPMSPQSVMANLHLSGGSEMRDWMDALDHMNGHGGGHMMDMDEMMDWMHDIEMPGDYHWNDDHDICEFVPNGGLMPDTEYMLLLNGGMRSHTGELMATHHLTHDGFMYHFRTAP